MKKEITLKQFKELSLDERIVIAVSCHIDPSLETSYLPDIGMMIEFLGEDWWHSFFKIKEQRYISENKDCYHELCDELWELTKRKVREEFNT